MRQFVAASAAEGLQSDGTASEVQLTDREIDTPNSEQAQCRAEKRALRQDEEALRAKRRQQRQHRQQEDTAFKTLKAERRAQQERRKTQIQANQRPESGKAADEQWKAIRQQRQTQMQQRQQENQQWRKEREQLRLRASQIQSIVAWIAILAEGVRSFGRWSHTARRRQSLCAPAPRVIVDNCTRQSVGLPLFVTGAKVTAQTRCYRTKRNLPLVVEALRQLLPDQKYP